MKCPACPDSTLTMTDRQGVEIDYCPQCRGVWLDRGELDKLMDRAAAQAEPARAVQMPQPDFRNSDHHGGQGQYQQYPQQQRRKKSWMSEIFD